MAQTIYFKGSLTFVLIGYMMEMEVILSHIYNGFLRHILPTNGNKSTQCYYIFRRRKL